MKKVITLLALFSIAVFAQDTFTDPRDGKKYKTAKIGKQTWMAQNLDYHGEDGFLGLCYGDEPEEKIRKPENCTKYGRLYDWNEAKKACPKGWHLPSDKEWQTLVDFAGGEKIAGKKLKAKSGWPECDFLEDIKKWEKAKKNVSYKRDPKTPKCKWEEEEIIDNRGRVKITEHDHCVTDEYGFSAMPGGGFDLEGNEVADGGSWWSATGISSSHSYYRLMSYNRSYVLSSDARQLDELSVRCVKD